MKIDFDYFKFVSFYFFTFQEKNTFKIFRIKNGIVVFEVKLLLGWQHPVGAPVGFLVAPLTMQ